MSSHVLFKVVINFLGKPHLQISVDVFETIKLGVFTIFSVKYLLTFIRNPSIAENFRSDWKTEKKSRRQRILNCCSFTRKLVFHSCELELWLKFAIQSSKHEYFISNDKLNFQRILSNWTKLMSHEIWNHFKMELALIKSLFRWRYKIYRVSWLKMVAHDAYDLIVAWSDIFLFVYPKHN